MGYSGGRELSVYILVLCEADRERGLPEILAPRPGLPPHYSCVHSSILLEAKFVREGIKLATVEPWWNQMLQQQSGGTNVAMRCCFYCVGSTGMHGRKPLHKHLLEVPEVNQYVAVLGYIK